VKVIHLSYRSKPTCVLTPPFSLLLPTRASSTPCSPLAHLKCECESCEALGQCKPFAYRSGAAGDPAPQQAPPLPPPAPLSPQRRFGACASCCGFALCRAAAATGPDTPRRRRADAGAAAQAQFREA
jgi:hypothetical protein